MVEVTDQLWRLAALPCEDGSLVFDDGSATLRDYAEQFVQLHSDCSRATR
jgi:hypothetical protein